MLPEIRPKCVRCGKVVDPRGADERLYCFCRCGWPLYLLRADGSLATSAGGPAVRVLPGDRDVRGCGARIFFQVNMNEKRQPFDLETGKAHHATCAAFTEWKRLQREAERAAKKAAASAPPLRNPNATLEEFL